MEIFKKPAGFIGNTFEYLEKNPPLDITIPQWAGWLAAVVVFSSWAHFDRSLIGLAVTVVTLFLPVLLMIRRFWDGNIRDKAPLAINLLISPWAISFKDYPQLSWSGGLLMLVAVTGLALTELNQNFWFLTTPFILFLVIYRVRVNIPDDPFAKMWPDGPSERVWINFEFGPMGQLACVSGLVALALCPWWHGWGTVPQEMYISIHVIYWMAAGYFFLWIMLRFHKEWADYTKQLEVLGSVQLEEAEAEIKRLKTEIQAENHNYNAKLDQLLEQRQKAQILEHLLLDSIDSSLWVVSYVIRDMRTTDPKEITVHHLQDWREDVAYSLLLLASQMRTPVTRVLHAIRKDQDHFMPGIRRLLREDLESTHLERRICDDSWRSALNKVWSEYADGQEQAREKRAARQAVE